MVSVISDHRRFRLYAMNLIGVASLTHLAMTMMNFDQSLTAAIFRRHSNSTLIPIVGITLENAAILFTGVTRTNPAEGYVSSMFRAYGIGLKHLTKRVVYLSERVGLNLC